MNQENIGKLISNLRKTKGLTQSELAKKLNVTNKTVSRWECGNSIPDVSIISELAKILEIEPSELLKGTIKPNITINNKPYIQNKINKILIFIIKLFIFLAIILLAVLITYNKTKDYTERKFNSIEISSHNSDFSIKAKIFTTPQNKTFILTNLDYQGSLVGTTSEPLVKNVTIYVMSGEAIVFINSTENNKLVKLSHAFDNMIPIFFIVDNNLKLDKENTKLKIEYYNEKNELETIEINLIVN